MTRIKTVEPDLRRSSPLTRLQREMTAVVVNGKVGGAP